MRSRDSAPLAMPRPGVRQAGQGEFAPAITMVPRVTKLTPSWIGNRVRGGISSTARLLTADAKPPGSRGTYEKE